VYNLRRVLFYFEGKSMADIFTLTTRVDPALLFRRGEAGDPRLGETVFTAPGGYDAAPVVLLGCPQDAGVRRNGGRPGAADAPDAIRRGLYKLVSPDRFRLFDLGNTIIGESLEETHDTQQRVVEQLLRDGKIVISLGGGNDIAYPDCAALAAVAGDVLAINIDAHLDVRQSDQRHSGTPYRQLLGEGHLRPHLFHETAYQPFAVAEAHLSYLATLGVLTHSLRNVQREGVETFYRRVADEPDATSIFWGVDMDAFTAADAPGVSAPNPSGLRADDLLTIAQIAGGHPRTRVFEISEVNPAFDLDQRTCRLAAAAIWIFLEAFYKL
jgi:formiminoglutamase